MNHRITLSDNMRNLMIKIKKIPNRTRIIGEVLKLTMIHSCKDCKQEEEVENIPMNRKDQIHHLILKFSDKLSHFYLIRNNKDSLLRIVL